MDYLNKIFVEHVEFFYGALALVGGVARYLNGVTNGGTKFSLGVFLASTFVSGFSGYMFALLGVTISLPQDVIFVMAGTGGFFGDQTMKFLMEYVQMKIPKA